MGLFDSFRTTCRELEGYISDIESNMANNYKDAAQQAYKGLIENFERLDAEGKLNEKQKAYYGGIISGLSGKLSGYSHKDQKPYWTK